MSTTNDEVCASCGVTCTGGDDGIKLKRCVACKPVQYCSVACQKEHRPQHKRECKKRSAELRDELLFKQPENTHLGDCPICFLPMPHDRQKATLHSCCSKYICNGCTVIHELRSLVESQEPSKCPFCREPTSRTEEDDDEQLMKRIEANDPVALSDFGAHQYDNHNYNRAFELQTKAAHLGNVDAHYRLAYMYERGEGIERDHKKAIQHLEEAAIGGHPAARYNLGLYELKEAKPGRAVKHLIIGANLGDDESMKQLKELFKMGIVPKEDLASALRAHKDAVDATKSPQRERAEVLQTLNLRS